MRYPLTHKFLTWAGPTLVVFVGGCIALIAALAQSFPKVVPWAEHLFDQWLPVVTATWFIYVSAFVVISYIAALIFTGQPMPVKKTGLLAIKPMAGRERKADDEFRRRMAEAPPEEARRLLAEELERLCAPKKRWWQVLLRGFGMSGRKKHAAISGSLEPDAPDAQLLQDGAQPKAAGGHPASGGSWIPLDDAIRYLGQKSQWAERRSRNDPLLSIDVGQQLQDALTCADLSARGRKFHVLKGGIKDPPLHPLAPIPSSFWEDTRIDAYWALQGRVQDIASGRGESAVRSSDHEGMHDIRLDRSQVQALWPPRSDTKTDEDAFAETFDEIVSDRVPFIRLRQLCDDFSITLARFGPAQNNGYAVESALKEAAANGRLMVWGRPYQGPVKDNDPLVPVPAEHFLKYSFRHGNLEHEMKNHQTGTATMEMLTKGLAGIEGVTFYDLYLSLSQAKDVLRGLKANLPAS